MGVGDVRMGINTGISRYSSPPNDMSAQTCVYLVCAWSTCARLICVWFVDGL